MKAVIFDMDGVIVNSEDHWPEIEEEFLLDLGFPEDFDFSQMTGMSLEDIHKLAQKEASKEISFEEFRSEYDRKAEELYGEKVETFEGIIQLLELLDRKEVKVGLCSSSPMNWIKIVLERFDLGKYFDVIVSANEVEVPGKPEPEIYRYVAGELEVDEKNCIVVEDSEHGAESAVTAGMKCIGFEGTPDQDLEKADRVVSTGEELRSEIQERLE